MTALDPEHVTQRLPRWVPDAARHYLAHTETGVSMRALARASDCHPSTILRQVRRFEGRRDDPLIDAALRALSAQVSARDILQEGNTKKMNIACINSDKHEPVDLSQAQIDQDAKRVLRRLCECGAVLAVARDMDTAVVVRITPEGDQVRTAMVGRDIAQAMALKNWITCPEPEARIARYFITNTGRTALRRLTAEDENRAQGFGDTARSPRAEDATWDIPSLSGGGRPSLRGPWVESPLVGLARRKDRDGRPFLARDLVAVGERLREDYELVEVGVGANVDWEEVKNGVATPPPPGSTKEALSAHERIAAALTELGPGLADVVLRCCCYLDGLEQTEKDMGWSARSGKIVLRIALQRLKRHYAQTQGRYGPMIG